MLGSIAAILIGVWFYVSAPRSGRPPLAWAVSGIVVYFLACLLWTLLVTPALIEAADHGKNGLLVFMVRYAYILVGMGVAFVLNAVLNKAGD